MAMDATQIEQYIRTAFPDATIELVDLAGDNDHWQVTVTSEAFRGKSRVEQHKMVFNAFGGQMGSVLHALVVKTAVPAS
ncbi:MAG: BolA family transcriptional regulator [Alphaproteobacteria bacterium]|nr:BolA family transcriptional regulator [Alphaproteobacteria bacterium]